MIHGTVNSIGKDTSLTEWKYSPYAAHDSPQYEFPLPMNSSSDIVVTTVYDATNGRKMGEYDGRLRGIGFLSSHPSDVSNEDRHREIHNVLYRLLVNPSFELCTVVNQYTTRFTHFYSIGVQIRMGGHLSNLNDATFMNMNRVDRVIEEVKGMIVGQGPSIVFVSTDSPSVLDYLQTKLSDVVRIQHLKEYQIGHSATITGKNGNSQLWEEATKRAIVDLMILKECDRLIVTRDSSFGDLAIALQQSYQLGVTLLPFLKEKGLNCSVYRRKKGVGSYIRVLLVCCTIHMSGRVQITTDRFVNSQL